MAEAPVPPEIWCHTDVGVYKFSNMWTINNFNSRENEDLKSSSFCCCTNDDIKWCIQLFPKGSHENYRGYISVRVTLVECNKTDIRADFTLFIIDNKLQNAYVRQGHSASHLASNISWSVDRFIGRSVLLDKSRGLLSDDKLTLCCVITLLTGYVNSPGMGKYNVPECTLLDDFEQLLYTKMFSDVIISVDGKEFHAHKAILSVRSPVFSAMFEHEMKEKKQNLVEIADMNQKVVFEMLRFIYTGRTPKLETLAEELLAAADKYGLERLRVLCEKSLSTKLSVDSAADLLALADTHSADQLKSHTLEFISAHASDVIETSGFKTLIQRHLHVIADAFMALATWQKP